jgi:short-subunit dehydrogenase
LAGNIVITGASSGLGRALAFAYAANGVTLGLFGRDMERLNSVATACRSVGARVETYCVDVADAESMRRSLFDFDERAPVELLIANAGISSGIDPKGAQESPETALRVLRINIFGTLNTIQPVLERMVSRRAGQIAIVGSLAAWRGLPSSPAYCASKAAIETYGIALRGMLRNDGVRVNVVSPGFVETPMSARVIGPRPFMISAAYAAGIIKRGLARDRARIAFPWPLSLATAVVAILPDRIADWFVHWFAFQVRPGAG